MAFDFGDTDLFRPGASLLFTLVFKNLGKISAPPIATAGVQ